MNFLNLKLFVIVLVLSTVFLSCKKEDNEPSNENQFVYKEKTVGITKGKLESFGKVNDDPLTYSMWLTFSSSTSSNLVIFEMYSGSGTELTPSTYMYEFLTENTDDVFTFRSGTIYADYFTSGNTYYVDSGSIEVNKSGDIYEIIVDCVDKEGKAVTAYYKGSLEYSN